MHLRNSITRSTSDCAIRQVPSGASGGLGRNAFTRFFAYAAALEMHPLDVEDRAVQLKQLHGIGYCNITKCCTRVCPEEINITDNAIIPLKERVVDELYDPFRKLFHIFSPRP